ncbi:MAG: hypothetical protein JWL81_91 [Verrucomicrobiales bacterium]|nr:hypothetical protein [Verrucomicrobiales bacterium]
MNTSEDAPDSAERWLEVVRAKVGAIRFGSVQITVHEGRVTQVEAIEKTRIDPERAEARVARKS